MPANPNIGQQIMEFIIDHSLVRTDNECGHLMIWSANAAEQIEAFVQSLSAAGPWTPISTLPNESGEYLLMVRHQNGSMPMLSEFSKGLPKPWVDLCDDEEEITYYAAINPVGETPNE